jgi:type II secretory ATPase GspE/PulE/Tfp pilus assembly ATPase PilB-like protein
MPPLQPPPEDDKDLSAYLEEPPAAQQGLLDETPADEELNVGPPPEERTEDAQSEPTDEHPAPEQPEAARQTEQREQEGIPGMDALREAILNANRKPEKPEPAHQEPAEPTEHPPQPAAPSEPTETTKAGPTGVGVPPPYPPQAPAAPEPTDQEEPPESQEPAVEASERPAPETTQQPPPEQPEPPMAEAIEEFVTDVEDNGLAEPPVDLAPPPTDAAEQVARGILEDAAARGASHVHLWLADDQLRLLLRLDGRLRETETFRRRLPGELTSGVLRSVRSLAGLSPARPDSPVKAGFTFQAENRRVQAHLVELPSHSGSTMVLRLSSLAAASPNLAALGLSEKQEATLRSMLASRAGVVLLAGRPGESLSDAREAIVGQLTCARRHVAATEPVGRARVTPLPSAGTLSDALEWAAEIDADAIELRSLDDPSAARAAIEAAADRLIVSRVTAGDLAEAMDSLLAGGVSAGRLAGLLVGVVAMRSARRLCLFCRREVSRAEADLTPLGALAREVSFPVWEATGCSECSQTGYRGVTHMVSLLPAKRALATELRRNPDMDTLDHVVRAAGGAPLREDALRLLRAGYTTPAEAATALLDRPGDPLV